MTKEQITEIIMDKTSLTKKEAFNLYKALTDEIIKEIVETKNSKLPCLGILKLKRRNERKGRNPKTGEEMVIAACNAISFKASKELKNIVNK